MRFALPRLSLGRIQSSRISTYIARRSPHDKHGRYTLAHTAPPPTPLPLKDSQDDLVASFLRFIDLLKDDETERIRDRFGHRDFQIPSRAKIAENVIHSLFERRLFGKAVAVYQHMLADMLIPSPSTDALFLAMTLATSTAPGEDQLEGLKTILAYRSFQEVHFIELLDHLVSLNIPLDTVEHLVRVFIDIKGRPSQALIVKLVDIQTQAGDVIAAAETVAEYELKGTFDAPAQPYAQIIKSAPTDDQEAVDWIMGVMREKDVPINIMVFNALLGRAKEAGDMRKAFSFYSILSRLAETTPLRPNAVTYKHLFRILGYQYKTNYKPNSSRRNEPIGTIPPPRQLFAEMMTRWFSTGFHPPASDYASERKGQMDADQGLLTIAFRTLVYQDDYAGALVVLRMIPKLGLQINERTYFIILRFLARRVYYDVYWARRQRRQPFLAFELMGPFDYLKMEQDPEAVYEWIMDGLLKHNAERVPGDEDEDDWGGEERDEGVAVKESWRGRIPTVRDIVRQSGGNLLGGRIDYFPIVNMLRRALQMRPSVNGVPWGVAWRKKKVRDAWKEMMPEKLELWAWRPEKMERRRFPKT
ncbi:hypothetical protein K438DRAFT_1850126 [Mycena galopus ATCC 62051]|nr:hypothetical protein K438DRAFT_1850126 [Mycena galopus ATCC 62051]